LVSSPERPSDPSHHGRGTGRDGLFAVPRLLATPESEWKPLIRWVEGKQYATDQEWAEVCYVPNWAGHSRKRADYRFLAIREPLRQLALGDEEKLPFPIQEFGRKGLYKLFGVVTNRRGPGDSVIWWLRERSARARKSIRR
jgi:hypothetical protein